MLICLAAGLIAMTLGITSSRAAQPSQEPEATPTPTPAPMSRVIGHKGTFGGMYTLGAQVNGIEDELGKPTKRRKTGKRACEFQFASMNMKFTAFAGPYGACSDGSMYVYGRVTTGWQTDKGLLVGDPSSRIKELYPKARRTSPAAARVA